MSHMSVPTATSTWDAQLSKSLQARYNPTYEPKANANRYTLSLFVLMLDQIIEGIAGAALAKFPTAERLFIVNPETSLKAAIENCDNLLVEGKSEKKGDVKVTKSHITELYLTIGLDRKKEESYRKLAILNIQSFVTTLGKPCFFSGTRESNASLVSLCKEIPITFPNELETWKFTTGVNGLNFIYSKTGGIVVEDPVLFTDKDFTTFEINSSDCPVQAKNINCLAFTLLRVAETRAKKYIFQPLSSDTFFINFPKTLVKWGYTLVDGTPQNNDIVVYLNNKDIPTHVGYFANNRVISKLGYNNSKAHSHAVFDISPLNGTKVIFFRKNSGNVEKPSSQLSKTKISSTEVDEK